MAENEAGEDAMPPSGPFETPDELTDVTFVVEGRKLYFYRGVLSLCSPVFKQMLSSDFKEKDAKEIPLPETKYDHMEAFFVQIHPAHSSTPVTDITLEQILPLADEYQVETLRQKCEQYIGNQLRLNLRGDQVLLYLWQCEVHRLPKYRTELVERGAKNQMKDLEVSRFYISVPLTAKCDLLTARTKALDGAVYGAVRNAFAKLSKIEELRDACPTKYNKCYGDASICKNCFKSKLVDVVRNVKDCKDIQPPL